MKSQTILSNKMQKRGFTLIELLIVVAILAILSTATVLILNPAQILQESRDTQRINDLGNLSSAISLMQATSTCSSLGGGSGSTCPVSADATFACVTNVGSSSSDLTAAVVTGTPTKRFFLAGTEVDARNGVRTTSGLGWMAADLSLISGGSPISVLPQDPINDITSATIGLNYQYSCTASSKYQLDANMESVTYSTGGSKDVESNTKDGGTNNNVYETGSTVAL
jgi:prepilin-type N-terminal cleavage/methylation domain-containing protein